MTDLTKENRETIFKDKYLGNTWGSSESRSGPGSTLRATAGIMSFLNFNVGTSLGDIGCGDFNWMKEFLFPEIKYTGYDIVKEIIDDNTTYHSADNVVFKQLDIVEEVPDKHEVILCKDVSFHLSFEDTLKALDNIKASGAEYLISTTFVGYDNTDIKTGGWRPINLEAPPFNLGKPQEILYNCERREDQHQNKSLAIWRIKGDGE